MDTCVHAYISINFIILPHPFSTVRTYLRGYISIAKGVSACVSPFSPPFAPQFFSIGARILVPVVFRVDGVQSDRYCLDCKFFACISIGPERRSMGGTSCKFPCPYPPAPVFACSTNLNDKCTYLLTTVRLICWMYDSQEMAWKQRRILMQNLIYKKILINLFSCLRH